MSRLIFIREIIACLKKEKYFPLKPNQTTSIYLKKKIYSPSTPSYKLHVYLNYTYLPRPLSPLIPAMDTNDVSAVKRNAQATISRLYDARVAATTERLDPLRAKARATLKDVDNFEVEKLDGQWGTDTVPKAPAANAEDAPMLSLRQLMPGSTGDEDEDTELDIKYKADKIEFMLVQRPLTDVEQIEGHAIEDASDMDWAIPTQDEYEDIMGLVFDVYTDD